MTKEGCFLVLLQYCSKRVGLGACLCACVMIYGVAYFNLLISRVTKISDLISFLRFYSGHGHLFTKQEIEEWCTVPYLQKDVFIHSGFSG